MSRKKIVELLEIAATISLMNAKQQGILSYCLLKVFLRDKIKVFSIYI
jgi:hypothetical protein